MKSWMNVALNMAVIATVAMPCFAEDTSTTQVGYFHLGIEGVWQNSPPDGWDVYGHPRIKNFLEEERWSLQLFHMPIRNTDLHVKSSETGFRVKLEPPIDWKFPNHFAVNGAIFNRSQQFGLWDPNTWAVRYKTDSRIHASVEPTYTRLWKTGRSQLRLNAIANSSQYVSTTLVSENQWWLGTYYRPTFDASHTWMAKNDTIASPRSTYAELKTRQGADVLGGKILLGHGLEVGLSYRWAQYKAPGIWQNSAKGPGIYLRGSFRGGKGWIDLSYEKMKISERPVSVDLPKYSRNENRIMVMIGFRVWEKQRSYK